MLHSRVTLTSLASGRHWRSRRDCRVVHARPHPGRGRREETQQLTANLKQLTENLTLHTLHPLSPHAHTHTHTHPLRLITSHYTHPPPHTRAHTLTSTADYDLSLHPPTHTHTHTHTPPLQRYDQSRWLCIQSFLFLNKKNSNSRDERYTIRWNKMFTFVAALISHKQIVWARD